MWNDFYRNEVITMRLKLIASLFTILLLITSLSSPSVHASTSSTEKLFTHSYVNKGDLPAKLWEIEFADVAADGQFIVAAEYGPLQGYFLMKMNNEKITLTKVFGAGDIRFVKEAGLIFFLSEETKMLEVYDESFKLLAKHDVKRQVPSSLGGHYIDFYVHNNYVSYHFDQYGYQAPVINYNDATPTGFIYNTVDKKVITHATFPALPINNLIYSDDYTMHYIDALGRIKKEIRYYIPTSNDYEYVQLLQVKDNSSTIAVQNKAFSSLQLLQTDLTGKTIQHDAFFKNAVGIPYNFVDINYNHAKNYRIFLKDKFAYYEYDVQSNTLSKELPLSIAFRFDDVSIVNEDWYYYSTEDGMRFTPIDEIEPVYTIQDEYVSQRNNHFAIASGLSSQHDQLFTMTDGTVHEHFYNSFFQFVGEDYLVTIQRDADEYSSNFKVNVYALYPVAPIAAASNKTWTVTFNDTIDAKTVTKDRVYVVNEKNEKQDVTLRVTKNQLFIDAPKSTYRKATYKLHIEDVTSTSGLTLQEKVTHAFEVR